MLVLMKHAQHRGQMSCHGLPLAEKQLALNAWLQASGCAVLKNGVQRAQGQTTGSFHTATHLFRLPVMTSMLG
jgi:hypothetical protein